MKDFLYYALNRLLHLIPFLIGITLVSFLLGVAAPGDPAVSVLTMDGSSEPTLRELAEMRQKMGLDQPVWVQYVQWLSRAVQGDLGISYMTQKSVLAELTTRIPVTFYLSFCALGWILLFGIPLGVWLSQFENTKKELAVRLFCLVLISAPGFWLGIIFMLLFSEHLQLLPASGYGTFRQMLMPSFVLAASTLGAVIRLQSLSIRELRGAAYILMARAKGLSKDTILIRHLFPNALMPVVTMLGTFFGSILGGSVIIEDMFSLPGLGSYVLTAIWGRDYPVIQGYVILSGTLFLLFNYLVDLSYYFLNPALRKGE